MSKENLRFIVPVILGIPFVQAAYTLGRQGEGASPKVEQESSPDSGAEIISFGERETARASVWIAKSKLRRRRGGLLHRPA